MHFVDPEKLDTKAQLAYVFAKSDSLMFEIVPNHCSKIGSDFCGGFTVGIASKLLFRIYGYVPKCCHLERKYLSLS